MKVIKLPNVYDKDLFCEDNASVLKADRIVEESVRCPFCNSETYSILFHNENVWSFFRGIKGMNVYTQCSCNKCGAKWESNKYSVSSAYSIDAIHQDVKNKCRKILKRDLMLI